MQSVNDHRDQWQEPPYPPSGHCSCLPHGTNYQHDLNKLPFCHSKTSANFRAKHTNQPIKSQSFYLQIGIQQTWDMCDIYHPSNHSFSRIGGCTSKTFGNIIQCHDINRVDIPFFIMTDGASVDFHQPNIQSLQLANCTSPSEAQGALILASKVIGLAGLDWISSRI